MAQRKARAKATGKRPGGKPPQPPQSGVRPNDQINLTDEESRIMPAGGKSFQQAYNVQAGVDTETLLIVTESVTTHANDRPRSRVGSGPVLRRRGPGGGLPTDRTPSGSSCGAWASRTTATSWP